MRITKEKFTRWLWYIIPVLVLCIVVAAVIPSCSHRKADETLSLPDYVDVQIIPINGIGRSGAKIGNINGVVVHYVANPGTTAQQNRDYFAKPETEVSSHFVIGLDGEVIQCVPLDEKAAASNERNRDTISIEVCHPDESGKFTNEAYTSLTELCSWLCRKYGLETDDIIRHYDVTGKNCPKYFVEHEDEWIKFKNDVKAAE